MTSSRILFFAVLVHVSTLSAAAQGVDSSGPIVLELFTSQGCSSCPPADRLLSRLGEEAGVVALSFHVDYWNYIGWTDPFSSEAWSKRQRSYARAFRSGRVYTPQLVVDGRRDCVGSDADEAGELLAEARRRKRSGHVELQVERVKDGDAVRLLADVAAEADGSVGSESLDLMMATFELDLVTPVGRGENARRTLKNDYVVRRLTKVLSITPGAASKKDRVTVSLDPAWRSENVGVAVFLQDPERLTIHGAAVWQKP